MDTVPGYGKLSVRRCRKGGGFMTSATYRVTGMTCEQLAGS